jgi:hypothetical protein
VTGARLGTTTVTTGRGPATVPAWLFTLEGHDTPLKRVAVTPSKPPKSPIGPAEPATLGRLMDLGRLKGVTDGGRSVTVGARHGDCDDGPVVKAHETTETVVLYASVKGTRPGPCTAQLLEQDLKVNLRRPLANRVLVDALTGRPVT